MLVQDRILALNVGASKIVLAEFAVRSGRSPELLNYGIGDLCVEPDNEAGISPYIVVALREVLSKCNIRPAPLILALSGQVVFPRFVKLPAVGSDKLEEMIRYEAEQNVPFPINEVVWDYQLIGDAADGEQHAMIVAVKTENITEITDCVVAAGLEPDTVDVAPMALYNCVRFNYPELTGCTMVLDIGARSTNLVFIEQGRVFSRTIPVAGNSITQEIAKSLQIDFKEAEELKRTHAFVALGGVFSSGDDAMADRVSKVVRNVVTRLHAEISRSINFYRSQQGGSAPTRIMMTGGSSVIPHMDTFFREKLQVDVETLNPFINVSVGPSLDPRAVAEQVDTLAEVVGLALRRTLTCPVEINLMPPELRKRRVFRNRLPFFGLAAVGVLLMMTVWTLYANRTLRLSSSEQKYVQDRIGVLQNAENSLAVAQKSRDAALAKAADLQRLIAHRTDWIRTLSAIRESLLPGMWLTVVKVEDRDASGHPTKLRIEGYRFKPPVSEANAARPAGEQLRDRIKRNPLFNGEVAIEKDREVADEQHAKYLLEFALVATLSPTDR